MKLNIFNEGLRLIEMITNKRYKQEQKDLYYYLLQDIKDNDYTEGIKHLLNNFKYSILPTPADIREAIDTNFNNKLELKKYKYLKIIKAISKYNDINFIAEDPVIHVMIDILGGKDKIKELIINNKEYIIDNEILNNFQGLYNQSYKHIEKGNIINLYINEDKGFFNKGEYIFPLGNNEKILNWLNKYRDKLNNSDNFSKIEQLKNVDNYINKLNYSLNNILLPIKQLEQIGNKLDDLIEEDNEDYCKLEINEQGIEVMVYDMNIYYKNRIKEFYKNELL